MSTCGLCRAMARLCDDSCSLLRQKEKRRSLRQLKSASRGCSIMQCPAIFTFWTTTFIAQRVTKSAPGNAPSQIQPNISQNRCVLLNTMFDPFIRDLIERYTENPQEAIGDGWFGPWNAILTTLFPSAQGYIVTPHRRPTVISSSRS